MADMLTAQLVVDYIGIKFKHMYYYWLIDKIVLMSACMH